MNGARRARSWALATIACAGGLLAAPRAFGDSVTYQGDPAHSGVIEDETVTPPLTTLWSGNYQGAPVIVGDTVYALTTLDADGDTLSYTEVSALDAATGVPEWTREIEPGGQFLAYDDGQVFVETTTGQVTALQAASGLVAWTTTLSDQELYQAPLTASGGLVYLNGSSPGAFLYALDETTGAVAWTQTMDGDGTSTPTVDDGVVYEAYPDEYYAFDATTGTPVWHTDLGGDGGGSATLVAVDGDLFGKDMDGVFDGGSGPALSAADGSSLGTFDSETQPLISGGTAYVTRPLSDTDANDVEFEAVSDDGLGAVDWATDQGGGGALLVGGTLWAATGDTGRGIGAIDPMTGNVVWSTNLPGDIDVDTTTGLSSGNGELLVSTSDGLVALESSTGLGDTPSAGVPSTSDDGSGAPGTTPGAADPNGAGALGGSSPGTGAQGAPGGTPAASGSPSTAERSRRAPGPPAAPCPGHWGRRSRRRAPGERG